MPAVLVWGRHLRVPPSELALEQHCDWFLTNSSPLQNCGPCLRLQRAKLWAGYRHCPKESLFKGYIDLEIKVRTIHC